MSNEYPVKYNGSIGGNDKYQIRYYTVEDNPDTGFMWVSQGTPRVLYNGMINQRYYTIRIKWEGVIYCIHNAHSRLYDNELLFMFCMSLVRCGRLLEGGRIDFNAR